MTRDQWLAFVAKGVVGCVALAVAGVFLSLILNAWGFLGVSSLLLFFAGVVVLVARDRLEKPHR